MEKNTTVVSPSFAIPSFLNFATIVAAGRPGVVNGWRGKSKKVRGRRGRLMAKQANKTKTNKKNGWARYIKEQRKDTWFSSEQPPPPHTHTLFLLRFFLL